MSERVGTLRDRIDSLAVPDGAFVVVCADTGLRPVPVDGYRFADRTAATRAAEHAAAYRARLWEGGPGFRQHDLVPVHVDGRNRPPAVRRVKFCQSVVGAVYTALEEQGHRNTGVAVLDAYRERAPGTPDPDALAVELLGDLAVELDAFDAATQTAVLRLAATHLPPLPSSGPSGALEALADAALLDDFALSGPPSARTATLRGYAFDARDGLLPVLPLALGWFRAEDAPPAAIRAERTATGWHCSFGAVGDGFAVADCTS